jgi:type I restriction enzyme, S subunit
MNWTTVEFESLYSIPSRNGLNRPSGIRGKGYKFINMGELFGHDRIGSIEMERVEMNDKELATMLIEEGDLLFARQSLVLSGAGKCSIVKEVDEPTTFESHLIRIRLKRELANPYFYHYYFKSPKCPIRSIVTQGVQAGIRGNDLKQLKIHLPPIEIQNRIADIISAYDDLIENNRRRIQLLERSLHLLYKEWFVNLRFPSHEHSKIVDGIPEGWEKLSLGDLAESVMYGYTASAQESGEAKLLRITDIAPDTINWDSVPFCEIDEQNLRKFALQEGDVVVARTGATVGYAKRIGSLESPTVFASYLIRFRFTEKIDNYLAGIFIESDEYKNFVVNNAGGAAQPNANAKVLSSATVLVPTQNIQRLFRDYVEPICKQKDLLQKENRKLKQARDLLLPKLMSGAISV